MPIMTRASLGLAISPLLWPALAPQGVAFWPFALYMAAAMSITAFPIMARILKERRMTHTTIGRLSLTGAAVADVFAWIMLAVVVILASAKSDWTRLWTMLGGVSLLALVVFLLLRPLFAKLLARYAADGKPGGAMLATLMVGMFSCAYATNMLGVHEVFGAFLFGTCLPRDDRLLGSLAQRTGVVGHGEGFDEAVRRGVRGVSRAGHVETAQQIHRQAGGAHGLGGDRCGRHDTMVPKALPATLICLKPRQASCAKNTLGLEARHATGARPRACPPGPRPAGESIISS